MKGSSFLRRQQGEFDWKQFSVQQKTRLICELAESVNSDNYGSKRPWKRAVYLFF